jgi:hypothetical protein
MIIISGTDFPKTSGWGSPVSAMAFIMIKVRKRLVRIDAGKREESAQPLGYER